MSTVSVSLTTVPNCEYHDIPMTWVDAGRCGISEWQCPKCEEEFIEEFDELFGTDAS